MNQIYGKRRDEVIAGLGRTGALVLSAAPEIIVGRDTELRYAVDPDLYYLTGYSEPEAVLVLLPRADESRFILFVRGHDAARELWTGVRGGVEEALSQYGATTAYPIGEIGDRLPKLLEDATDCYARIGRGRPEIDALLGHRALKDPGEILDTMRLVKDEHEISLMREAARIARESFAETLPRAAPGIAEFEIEAAIEYGFRVRGADGASFPTIAAAGRNATTLHYVKNAERMRAGQLFLLDAGARYRMYCSDMTRTVPVSGAFTAQQRDLYDVVQSAHAAAIAATRPGVPFDAPHQAAQRILAEGLIGLRYLQGSVDEAIADEARLKRYFPHRTSHWLGLDVHDVGGYTTADGPIVLAPNMVLTIEPGIYMRDLGVGIRIEDDVLVTESGHEVLTA